MFDISFLWTVLADVLKGLSNRNKETAEAIGAIRKAFNFMYDYLRNNQGGYIHNIDLANLWGDASIKVMIVDKGLGDLLADKSRFWLHPEFYTELNRGMNVLTLVEITDEMERLRKKIK